MAENINFVDEKERELFARAELGVQAREFLDSPMGRYLQGRAQREIEQAQVDALECNPRTWWGRRKLLKLQERAATARYFVSWVVDALQDGNVAYQELKEHRQEE